MDHLERAYDEKRNFIRMNVDTPVTIEVFNRGDNTISDSFDGYCHDLSGSGMLISAEREIPNDTELVVTLGSNNGLSHSLRAQCNITRVESGPNSTSFFGLEIVDIINEPGLSMASEA